MRPRKTQIAITIRTSLGALLCALFISVCQVEAADAATRHASPADFSAALKQLKGGDTLLLRNGIYPQLQNPLPSGSSALGHTTLACENFRQCTIAGTSYGILLNRAQSYVRFSGLRIDRSSASETSSPACFFTNSSFVITNLIVEGVECFAKGSRRGSFFIGVRTTDSLFRNNYFHDHGSHGFYMAGSNNVMEFNRMERLVPFGGSGNTAYCAQIYLQGGTPQGNIFRDNYCDTGGGKISAGSNGLYIGSGPNNRAYRNTIINAVNAFMVRQSGTKLWNNTIHNVTTAFNLAPGSGCEIKNNILLGKPAPSHSNCATANNLTTGKPEDIFVNHTKGDFRLKPTAAAAIDKGTPIPNLAFRGAAADIGAWEFEAVKIDPVPIPDPIPDPKPDPVPIKPTVSIDVTLPPEVELELKVNGVKK